MEESETLPQGTSAPAETPAPVEQPSSVLDVDSAERVKFDGREWSREELRKSVLMQSDYTKKMQEFSETRKNYDFYENLRADLAKVKRNPGLAQEFKNVYPEKFHDWVKDFDTKEQPNQKSELPEEFVSEFKSLKQMVYQEKIQAFEAQIDAKMADLSKKYPYADTEAVLGRLDYLNNKGEKITDQHWEKIFKTLHDRVEQSVAARQKEMVTKQKQATAKAKDTSSGGGIPSDPPVQHKSIQAAGNAYLKSKGWA